MIKQIEGHKKEKKGGKKGSFFVFGDEICYLIKIVCSKITGTNADQATPNNVLVKYFIKQGNYSLIKREFKKKIFMAADAEYVKLGLKKIYAVFVKIEGKSGRLCLAEIERVKQRIS